MLAAGLLLAGAVVAVVLLEFRALGTIGQTVAIAALALLSGTLIWTGVRIGGRIGVGDGKASRLPDDASPVKRVAEVSLPAEVPVPSLADAQLANEVSEEASTVSEGEPPPYAATEDARDDRDRPRDSDATVEPATDTAVEPGADTPVERADGVGEDESVESAPVAESTVSPRAAEPESGVARKVEARAVDLQDYRKKLIAGWDRYRVDGDGHFNTHGLEQQLNRSETPANVRDGGAVEAEGSVLVVEHPGGDDGRFFVLPSFTKSPRASPDWFHDAGDGALTRRTRTIHKLAEGEWTDSQFAVIKKGRIE